MSKIDDYIIFEYLEGNLPEEQAHAVEQQIHADPLLQQKLEGFTSSIIPRDEMIFPKQALLIKPWYATLPWKTMGLGLLAACLGMLLWPADQGKEEQPSTFAAPQQPLTPTTTPNPPQGTQTTSLDTSTNTHPTTVKHLTAQGARRKTPHPEERDTPTVVAKPVIGHAQVENATVLNDKIAVSDSVVQSPHIEEPSRFTAKNTEEQHIPTEPKPAQSLKKSTDESSKKTSSHLARKERRLQERHIWKEQRKRAKREAPTLMEALKGLKWSDSPPVKLED